MQQLSIFDYLKTIPEAGQTVYFATCGEIKRLTVIEVVSQFGKTGIRGMSDDGNVWIITKWYYSQAAAKDDDFYKVLHNE